MQEQKHRHPSSKNRLGTLRVSKLFFVRTQRVQFPNKPWTTQVEGCRRKKLLFSLFLSLYQNTKELPCKHIAKRNIVKSPIRTRNNLSPKINSARIPKIPTPAWKPCNFFFPKKIKIKSTTAEAHNRDAGNKHRTVFRLARPFSQIRRPKPLVQKLNFRKKKTITRNLKRHWKLPAEIFASPSSTRAPMQFVCASLLSRARALSRSLVLARPKRLSGRAHRLQRQGCDGPLVTQLYMNNHVIVPLC